ncbi:MAG: PQQ-dependent sugar dehydrogenase, partial [Chloroflexota bacterium]
MKISRLLPVVAIVGMLVISLSPVAAATESGDRQPQQEVFDPDTVELELETVFDGLTQPVEVTNAGDGSDRLFISERQGTVLVAVDGELQEEPFLDISDVVRDEEGEQGFFGVAFHPDFAENGTFFAVYTKEPNGDNVLARFQVSDDDPNQADPDSLTELISLEDQFANHNGGDLAFGPDGYLYYGTGDEGGSGDPNQRAQDMQSYFGKMLRLDVDNGDPYAIPEDNPYVDDPDALDEIWASGLRNPWRYSFD